MSRKTKPEDTVGLKASPEYLREALRKRNEAFKDLQKEVKELEKRIEAVHTIDSILIGQIQSELAETRDVILLLHTDKDGYRNISTIKELYDKIMSDYKEQGRQK